MVLLIIIIKKNINYRKKLVSQRQLIQLGKIARTLTHEIKNPLGAIRLQTGLLKKLFPGKGKDEILATITPIINNMNSLFMVDDISYLEKSGRIGKAVSVVGGFFQLKPILSIEVGEPSSKGFPLAGGNAVDKMIELMGEVIPFGSSIKLGMAHAMSPDKIESVKPKILGNYNCVEVYETIIGSSVGATMGPGSFGYVYFAI